MKILKAVVVAAMVAIAIPSTSSAAEETQMNPWADCGIGAMLFPKNETGAIISNLIWDLGTTAYTSMTASKEQCKGEDAVAALFIYETYANLEEETAMGGGKHVTAVLNILGCDNNSHEMILKAVRSDFASKINDASYADKDQLAKAKDYYNIVQNRTAGSCTRA
jgi:hypothetical protein